MIIDVYVALKDKHIKKWHRKKRGLKFIIYNKQSTISKKDTCMEKTKIVIK